MFPSWWRSVANTAIKIVTSRVDASRQGEGGQPVYRERRLADQDSTRAQQRHDQRPEFVRQYSARHGIAGRGIEMGEHDPIREAVAGDPQRLAHIAEQQKLGWRHAIGMGGDPALADIDFAIRKQLAEMIVSSTVAEAELKHLALEVAHQFCRAVQTGPLGFETPDKAIEPAQAD